MRATMFKDYDTIFKAMARYRRMLWMLNRTRINAGKHCKRVQFLKRSLRLMRKNYLRNKVYGEYMHHLPIKIIEI